jgi:glutathione synthase
MNENERSAYIIMDRIIPPISQSYMIRPGMTMPPKVVDLVSELGIFGAIIGSKEKILYNQQVGHMLRTKTSDANEGRSYKICFQRFKQLCFVFITGGVAAGLGALDSPYLFD